MCRPKSEKTLELERERHYRREQREHRHQEREERRQIRLEKRQRRDEARSYKLKPTPRDGRGFGNLWAPVHYLCQRCHNVKLETEMKAPDLCEQCFYSDAAATLPIPASQLDLFL